MLAPFELEDDVADQILRTGHVRRGVALEASRDDPAAIRRVARGLEVGAQVGRVRMARAHGRRPVPVGHLCDGDTEGEGQPDFVERTEPMPPGGHPGVSDGHLLGRVQDEQGSPRPTRPFPESPTGSAPGTCGRRTTPTTAPAPRKVRQTAAGCPDSSVVSAWVLPTAAPSPAGRAASSSRGVGTAQIARSSDDSPSRPPIR